MNIFNRNEDIFSNDEIEKAEILEAYTCKLEDERLSRHQKKFLKSDRYDEELGSLKLLINYAHRQAENEVHTIVATPRTGAALRVKTKLSELISDKNRRPFDVTSRALPNMVFASRDQKGSDTDPEVTVYGESLLPPDQNTFVLKFEVIEGDEKRNEYSVTFPKQVIDDGSPINAESTNTVTIGRGNSAEIQIKDLSHKMSRIHAKLEAQNGSIYITDLDSTNGIYVDGVHVNDSAKLSPGSTVKLGGVIIQILSID